MKKLASFILVGLVTMTGLPLAGCAGQGETVSVDLRGIPPAAPSAASAGEKMKTLVVPFEDLRPQKNRLGMRTHFWGGVTYFDVPGGKPGDLLAHVVAEYFKRKGWQAEVGQSGKAGASEPEGKPDVMLTGQVQEFAVNAKSRFGSTEITVKLKVSLRGVNASDDSTTKLTLAGTRTSTVVWFTPEEVQALVTATLQEGLEKLFGDVKVEGKSLRLK